MQSKNAISNLKNRYTAVLKKCHLINTFGSLALVGFLCLSVNTAQAEDGTNGPDVNVSNQNFTITSTSSNFIEAYSRGEDATGNGKGGDGGTATANNNTTTTSGTMSNAVAGSFAESFGGNSTNGNGGNAGTVTANKNTIYMNGRAEQPIYGGYASSVAGDSTIGNGGNAGTATANNNTVHVNGTTRFTSSGSRAFSKGGDSANGTGGNAGTATAFNNTIDVNGIVELNVIGGNAESLGGSILASGTVGNGGSAAANYNTANVSGIVKANVYGGLAESQGGFHSGSGIRGNSGTATASHNTVHLNNATIGTAGVSSYIIGGLAIGDASSRAENNTVILSNNLTINGSLNVYGGSSATSHLAFATSGANFFNGNTLILNQYKGGIINRVVDFEKYAFILDPNESEHVVTAIRQLYLDSAIAGKSAYVSDISTLTANNYVVGKTYTLITVQSSQVGTFANLGQNITGYEGVFVENIWKVNKVGADIVATLISKQAGDRAEHFVSAYGETVAAMLTTSNNALMQGIESARNNTQLASVNAGFSAGSEMKQNIFMPFATIYGGYSSVGDDNNIDINSLSLVGGLGYTSYLNNSELLLAAFFEAGHAGYNSYANNLHSEGDANYYGAGLFTRYDMYAGSGNAYAEASAKVGSMAYDYYSDDIKNALGVATSYDVDSLYYGAHLGLGYVWNINNALDLDMSAKYFYTHQDGLDEEIGGNNFDVDGLDSHRVRAGARLSYTMPTSYDFTFTPYMGLYYEHEFNDDVSATVDNFAVPSSSDNGGSTGVVELGVELMSTMNFSLNMGAEASLGERESALGKLEFKYRF